jgi:glycosyltransferase involved in cell wall biosynthesis
MRVLLVADFYPPAPGGLEGHVRRLAHELRRTGHDVAVVSGGGPGRPSVVDDHGVAVYQAPSGVGLPGAYQEAGRAFHPPWPQAAFRRALEAAFSRFDPQVVHAHGWCAFSAAAEARRHGTPVVVTLHDHGLRCPKKTLLRGDRECAHGRGPRCATCPGDEQGTLKRCVLAAALGATTPALVARADRFLAVSDHVARRARAVCHGRVDVVPNFLDPPAGSLGGPVGTDVLYVGPADRHKGLSVLLDAWRFVPSGHLVVVGADRPAGAVPPRVTFAGRLGGDPLWARYRSAALVVVPSIWPEPCPTVVLEAFAFGRPVIGSNVGGIPDLVDGSSGVLVPPGDPHALAAAIADLASDRPGLAEMGRAAHERAARFTTEAVVARIVRVYDEVVDGADRTVRA